MKRVRIASWCVLLAVWLSAACPAAGQAAQPEKNPWSTALQRQVASWIDGVAKQDGQFREWKGAAAEVRALGANSHQWIVTLRKSGRTVGYLIVGEQPARDRSQSAPSFALLEYGLGESVLFSDAFAPKVQDAEPVYDGFASYWQVAYNQKSEYVDAKTGERYPALAQPDQPVIATLAAGDVASSGQQLSRSLTLSQEQTDPFDRIDWLTDGRTPPAGPGRPWESLWQLKPQQVVVNASLFHNEVWAPFVVESVHVWNDDVAYLGVWDDGLRFLPYAYVNKVGKILIH